MSVNRTIYIIYGLKIADEDFEKLLDHDEDWIDNNRIDDQEVGVLYDGMGGEYAVVGKELHSFDEYDSFGIITFDILSEVEKVRVKEQIEKILGYKVDKLDYILVDHYS